MWVNERRFNTMRPEDPSVYLAVDLRTELSALPISELAMLDVSLRDTVDELYETLYATFQPADEAEYYGLALPAEYVLEGTTGREALLPSIERQLEQIPLRWRLEAASVIGYYISDYGPPDRRYTKALKKARRQRNSTESASFEAD